MNILDITPGPDLDSQQLLMTLDIYTESILRTLYEHGQPVQVDELSPLDVAVTLADVYVNPGLLPANLLYYARRGRHESVALYLPPETRLLRLHTGEVFTVPCPPLVFAGSQTTYRLAALAEAGWPTAAAKLFHAPFPNVYTSCRVCHGSVSFPEAGLMTIHQAVRLFFESEFNLDLGNNKSMLHRANVTTMWRTLAEDNRPEYPAGDLISMDTTLEVWLNETFR